MKVLTWWLQSIPIPFDDVTDGFNAFLSSPIVGGSAAMIISIGLGGFALYKLRKGLSDGG